MVSSLTYREATYSVYCVKILYMICRSTSCFNPVTGKKIYCSTKCKAREQRIRTPELKNKVYARHKKWRERNPEKARSYFNKWVRTEKGMILHNISIAKWKGTDSQLFYRNRYQLCFIEKRPCAACNTPYQRGFICDHIIPRRLGGTHELVNLQILCPKCNSIKTALDIHNISKYKT